MKKYQVGVNNYGEDADYCQYADHQYTIELLAENEEEAKKKAVDKCKEEFSGILVSDLLKVAWIEEEKDRR